MSVRQYIGARYVTKIYENSLDPSSAEWEGGRAYEPLTLVTYLNSSYLSKKEVPASVGDPASNPAYWVITGAYNGQILQLQNDVSDLQTEVAALHEKKYIMGGDSYSIENFGHTGWIDLVNAYMGLTRNVNSFDARDLVGYYGGSFAGGEFLTQLQAVHGFLSDPDEITDICYFAGTNEVVYTDTQISDGIANFMAYAKTNFPNALVTIGFIGGSAGTSNWSDFQRAASVYKNAAIANGARYCDNIEYANVFYNDYYDGLHPNNYIDIAKYITNGIYNGSVHVQHGYTKTISGYGTVSMIQDNGTLKIYVKIATPTTMAISTSWNKGITEIIDLNEGYMPFIREEITWAQPLTYQEPGDPFYTCNLLLTLTPAGKLLASVMTYPDSTGLDIGTNLSYAEDLRYITTIDM